MYPPLSSPPPEPLDYRPHESEPFRPRRLFSATHFILTTGVMLIVLAILRFVIPRFEAVLQDLATTPPMWTRTVVGISRMVAHPGGLAFGVAIAVSIGVLVAVLPIRGRALQLFLMVFLALIVLAFALAVVLPMASLLESLTQ